MHARAVTVAERIGPYRICGVVARGGMAVVLRAEHEATGERVAIKVLEDAASEIVSSIRREIHALRRVHHPGVVRIVDEGTRDGLPWYAMELLEGRTLRALHEEHWAALPVPRWAPLVERVAAVCEPLSVLHAAGIVHRDLKPENIVVTEERGPVLVDFGLAAGFAGTAGREVLAPAGDVIGTPEYMAPEQILGSLVDARADLYALGCILYECVLGRPPFRGATAQETLDQQLYRTPRAPSLYGVTVPHELEALLLRLLAKLPAHRIGFAEDVAASLRHLGFGGAAPSRPAPPYLYRAELTGRDDVMDRAQAVLETLERRGPGGAVFVLGESGVGKTRLGMEIAQRATTRGAVVVTGQCHARAETGAAPLHPFVPLASEAARRLPGPWGRVLSPYFPELASLPGWSSWPEPEVVSHEAARERVLDAVVAMVRALGTTAPTLLVIDDVQWADELSLAALARLGRPFFAERGAPWVIALCRAEEANDRTEAVAHAMGAARWDLGRLDDRGVAAMTAGMLAMRTVPRAWTLELARVSAGNPFFLAEYLRAAVGAGLLARDREGRWFLRDAARAPTIGLPTAIEALVARRIAGLEDDQQRLVAAAAVLGRSFDGELLASVSGLDEHALFDEVTALVRRHVLEEEPSGGLHFVHDRIWEVAYDRLEADVRRDLHRRAARAIEALGTGDATRLAPLARHHAGAAEYAAACACFLSAAQHAEGAYANEQAIALYRSALREAENANTSTDWLAETWDHLGALLQRVGDPAAACASYEHALAHAPPEARTFRGRVRRQQGTTWETRQRHDEALDCYTEAERALGEAPRDEDIVADAWWREWVQIQIERISIHYWAADMPALTALVDRLAPVVDRRGSPAQRARFYLSRVQRGLRRERYRPLPSTVEDARRGLAAYEETTEREATVNARFTLAAVLLWHDDLAEADEHMCAALEAAERMGNKTLQARCLAYLTVICRRRCELDAVRSVAWRCQSVAETAQMIEYIGTAEANLGWVRWREGDRAGAEKLCRSALARWHETALAHPFEWLARLPLLAIAEGHTLRDDVRAHARALLAPAQQRLPDTLDAALATLGDPHAGLRHLAHALDVAEKLGFM